jgi:hypothetical protein
MIVFPLQSLSGCRDLVFLLLLLYRFDDDDDSYDDRDYYDDRDDIGWHGYFCRRGNESDNDDLYPWDDD